MLLTGTTRKVTSQKGGFLSFFKPLMVVGLPLMKNVLTPLAKSIFVPFGLTIAASAMDAAIQKKRFGSGSTLLFSNEDMNDIMLIVKFSEESGLLIEGVNDSCKWSKGTKKQIPLDVRCCVSCCFIVKCFNR